MGSFSIWHWMVVLVVVLLLFGSGKISGLMGDVAKGIKSFKANIKEDEKPADASMTAESAPPAGTIAGPLSPPFTQPSRMSSRSPPFTFFANGAPFGRSPFARQTSWTPDGPGYVTLSVVDAEGRSDLVKVFA